MLIFLRCVKNCTAYYFSSWWSKEDEYNFNKLTSKVVKYYEKYEQFGDITLAENIADLGGMSIVLRIA